jgi:hypothetical protein
MMLLADEDILLRLTTFEDSFVERKTAGDSKDWLKTVVAFANSAPVGYPAILFIGVRDDGTVEEETNLDSLQRTLSEKVSAAYPPIYFMSRVLRHTGKQFLAVLVPGSASRPHFAGPAFIREGSKSVQSSAAQFETLVAERNSKIREIRKWNGKLVRFQRSTAKGLQAVDALGTIEGKPAGKIVDCNLFYVTVEGAAANGRLISIPLGQIEINFDHVSNCLELRLCD